MYRQGIITEIYPDKGTCRVKFLSDDIVSKPLQICMQGAQDNKFHAPFAINELVACLVDENNEDGVVLGALYNDDDTPSGATGDNVRIVFKDGSVIDYDFAAHKLTIDMPTADVVANCKKADISASGKVTINAPAGIEINGDVSITGTMTASGDITSSTEVTAQTIKLTTHVHSGVQPGGGTTAVPVP